MPEETQDTLEEKRARSSFWEKLGFGIGYSGGICYTGKDLMKRQSDWDPLAFLDFSSYLYWLNSFEASIYYPVNKKWGIEIGGGYGWAKLGDRKGLESVRIPNAVDSIDGWLATSSNWTLEKISLFIGANKNSIFTYGVEITYSRASTKESIWAPILIEEAEVRRRCFGGGIFFLLRMNYKKNKKINILPFVGGRISFAYEYTNNSPWKNDWQERLNISFSGLYVGLQFFWGGV